MDMSLTGIPDLRTSDIYNMSKLESQMKDIQNKVGSINKDSKLYKASEDFEALFIKQMLNVMRKTVPKDGLLEGGFAEDIFEDMLYDEYAKKMAETANFGIAKTIYDQYSKYVQE
jgi:flagellar protein FlgJ